MISFVSSICYRPTDLCILIKRMLVFENFSFFIKFLPTEAIDLQFYYYDYSKIVLPQLLHKVHISWFFCVVFLIKVRKSRNVFFEATFPPKKWTNKFYFTTMKPQVDLFSFVFWRKLKTPTRHFKINWPLRAYCSHIYIYCDVGCILGQNCSPLPSFIISINDH